MWLWTVCQRPALLPPVTMLRMLSLRLGPAPLPEQAPPPLSLAPGEGPAPPCPPLSTAPLGGNVGLDHRQRNTDRQEERTKRGYKEERERRTDERQTHRRTEPESKNNHKVSQTDEKNTLWTLSPATSVQYTTKTWKNSCWLARQSVN